MKKRLLLGLIALFLLIIPFSYAQNFTLEIRPVNDRITKGEWAIFDITIHNTQKDPDVFKLSSKVEGTEWSILTESTFDYATGVIIPPKTSKTVRILLKDKNLDVNPNKAYIVDLSAKSSNTGEKQSVIMQVFIVRNITIPFESDISVTPNIPRYLDPRNVYSFVINIKNNNPKDIKNLNVKLESSLVKREGNVELAPDMQKGVEFTTEFDENQKPLLDTLTISVSENGKELYRDTMPIEIVSYRIPFDQMSKISRYFLMMVEEITLTNGETVQEEQKFMYPISAVDSLFASSDPQTAIVEKEKKKYLLWNVKLGSGESTNLTVVTNYRLPFYILVVIAIIILLYYAFRHPIVIVKHAESVKIIEGGIREIKVVMSFKNRSKNHLKKVTIMDKVPHMIEVEKKHDLGTLLPKKVMRTKQGTLLIWEMEMEPKEERMIKYLVKSRLSIIGEMQLPHAVVFVEDEKGSKRKIKSNEVNISE